LRAGFIILWIAETSPLTVNPEALRDERKNIFILTALQNKKEQDTAVALHCFKFYRTG
jgi:hypothetical protein